MMIVAIGQAVGLGRLDDWPAGRCRWLGRAVGVVAAIVAVTLPAGAARAALPSGCSAAEATVTCSHAAAHVSDPAPTTTTLTSLPNPTVIGQTVMFTATVHTMPLPPPAVNPPPTGTVIFRANGTQIGTEGVFLGLAIFLTSTLPEGTHTITASYSGDANYSGSTGSLPVPQVVNKATTRTEMYSLPNPSTFGEPVTFHVAVLGAAALGSPTGTVIFRDDGAQVGTSTVSEGLATFTTSALATGTHTITASYGGDANFTGSTSSPVSQVVSSPPPPPPPPPPPGCPDPAGAFNQGFNTGFQPGFNAGFQPGYDAGFNRGYHVGFGRSADVPAARAHAAPRQALPPACDQNFNQGFNTGFQPGFDSGFNRGFQVGFNPGFTAGFRARHRR